MPISSWCLNAISSTDWLRLSDHVTIRRTEIADGLAFELNLGGRLYPADHLEVFNCGRKLDDLSQNLLPTQLRGLHAGWQEDIYLAIRPLILFTVSGAPALFEMAKLALEAIDKHSQCDVKTALICKNVDIAVVQDVFFRSQHRFDRIVALEDEKVEDFTFARYFDFSTLKSSLDVENFCPIIYLDSDVLCDAALDKFVKEARLCSGILALSEGKLMDQMGWYGDLLLESDPTVKCSADECGLNSGILAASDFASFNCFARSVSLLHSNILSSDAKLMNFHDQPLVNYLSKKGLVDIDADILAKFARIVGHASSIDVGGRLGLAHFAGGVGNHGPKLPRMREYLSQVSELSAQ